MVVDRVPQLHSVFDLPLHKLLRQPTVLLLAPELSRWSWRRWSITVDATPGPLHLLARAWDTTGALQPESAAALWNPKGYANNSWAQLSVSVE